MGQPPFEQIISRLQVDELDCGLFRQALTHKSYLGEVTSVECNERLEFLGDSILGMIVSEYLYLHFPDKSEGELSKVKAVAVSEPILAEASKKIGIPATLLLSAGEDGSGGRERASILSDAFEAVIAAIYLTQGFESAKSFILDSLGPILDNIDSIEHHRNYKSTLQELSQEVFKQTPKYVLISESGADHDKTFIIDAELCGKPLGRGIGKTKKQAEQEAAYQALLSVEFESVYERKHEK